MGASNGIVRTVRTRRRRTDNCDGIPNTQAGSKRLDSIRGASTLDNVQPFARWVRFRQVEKRASVLRGNLQEQMRPKAGSENQIGANVFIPGQKWGPKTKLHERFHFGSKAGSRNQIGSTFSFQAKSGVQKSNCMNVFILGQKSRLETKLRQQFHSRLKVGSENRIAPTFSFWIKNVLCRFADRFSVNFAHYSCVERNGFPNGDVSN